MVLLARGGQTSLVGGCTKRHKFVRVEAAMMNCREIMAAIFFPPSNILGVVYRLDQAVEVWKVPGDKGHNEKKRPAPKTEWHISTYLLGL